MFKLIWIVVVMSTPPTVTQTPEKERFKTEAECTAFAEKMAPRIEDWTRGAVGADWHHETRARFRCELEGHDA
jgi:hypothetical protein